MIEPNEIVAHHADGSVELATYYRDRTRKPHNFVIDGADLRWVQLNRWTCKNGRPYIYRSVSTGGCQRILFIHQAITNPPPGFVVDHINGDPLDNRRSNLRVVTQQQNSWNVSTVGSGTSGRRGIYMTKDGRYAAQITRTFATREEAVAQREAWEEAYFGEFRRQEVTA